MGSPISSAAAAPRGTGSDASPHPRADVAAWVHQLSKTLKTCRLYDSENPTVIRFREDLGRGLGQLLERGGPLTLHFTSNDVVYEDVSAIDARSREENLARPFHRDGILAITFLPGIEPDEVETFVDCVLRVTGPRTSDEDLVTLLWDAAIAHFEIERAPDAADGGGGDGGGGEGGPAGRSGTWAPWPKQGLLPGGANRASADCGTIGRSDDWQIAEQPADLESDYERIEREAPSETERFLREIESERSESVVRSALSVIGDSLAADSSPDDRAALGRFLPRVLRVAIRAAEWREAREALGLLRSCEVSDWSPGTLVAELSGPFASLTPQCIALLDQQPPDVVDAFLTFARELGPDGVEWLMAVLAGSQQKAVRRPLTRVIADLAREHPDQLRPWLSNKEWYVVRNVVHICGWIGGAGVIGLLRDALNHSEPRVRQEIVAALSQEDRTVARPILLDMLEGAEGRLFREILNTLSQKRDPIVAKRLLSCAAGSRFAGRSVDERRSVYAALAACAGNDTLPSLEAELLKASWFSLSPDPHRRALARCLATIASPGARAILDRGARSWRPAIRKACREAAAGSRADG